MPGHISAEMRMLALVGVCIVFGVLALIALVVAIFKRLDDRWQAHEAALAEQSTGRTQNIDDTTVVLIKVAAS